MSLRKLKWRGIGRLELLAWLNEFLQTDYTKIEHLADGIAYCQIFDALYPGKVNLQRLNFQARTEMEYEHNLKVLRRTFHLCDIRKEIPIRKLVQGIFQEHFEFLHWIHDYVHRTYPDAVRSYHGFERRQEALRLSDSDVKLNNTNLIPKYSNLLKTPREGYIEGYALELDEVRAIESSSFGDFPLNGPLEDQKVDSAPDDEEELDFMDPAVQFIRHSFSSTLRAKLALTKLEECTKSIGVVASQSKNASKSRRSNSRPQVKNGGWKTKSRTVLEFKDPTEPDPMVCRCISELIECLESELFGRVKDLQYLEKNVEALVESKQLS
ncbi:hypothetical protein PC128_g3104 [Phytophthora cactorum]|nr:hypothetical protein PC120_g1513 [Phytophthora cactorum]KAG3095361.1 hypothetical protein PC121_g2809 [Phytophthora cactorum]KAG3202598.1 hypothetical protein PC128_g3104 [Phytophthora cactorum]KAG4063430.1 hypothetical protein PC123_g1775 [Phytophthora cactorum]